MRIGIDISQIVFEGTGVARYVSKIVEALLKWDRKNEYILFGTSLRKRQKFIDFFKNVSAGKTNVKLVTLPIPPTVLEFLWNKLHIVPVEWFTGNLDIYWSSDWTQPPLVKAKGITTVHDVSIFRFPESFNEKIIDVQKKRLELVKKECSLLLCDSLATQRDLARLLGIENSRLKVVYPGFN